MALTQEILKERLSYNPENGLFTRLTSLGGVAIGSIAGCEYGAGYWGISLNNRIYLAHRLVFLYMTGSFPDEMADHINGDKLDNRWCNLRNATRTQNSFNSGKRSSNTSGYKGVVLNKKSGRWHSKIKINKKWIWLGTFNSALEASDAYEKAAKAHHGEFYSI